MVVFVPPMVDDACGGIAHDGGAPPPPLLGSIVSYKPIQFNPTCVRGGCGCSSGGDG